MDEQMFDTITSNEDNYSYSGSTGSEYRDDNAFYYDGDMANLEPWNMERSYIPMAVVYCLAFLVGIGGNALMMFTIARSSVRHNGTTMCLTSLAISGVLFLVVSVPYEVAHYFITQWQLGEVLCKLSGFVKIMSAVLTVLHLSMISVERFVAIVYPMQSRYLFTRGIMRKRLLVVWILAAFLASPQLFILSTEMSVFYNKESSVSLIFCSDHSSAASYRLGIAIYQFCILFVLPAVVMVICYVRVCHVLWSSIKDHSDMAHYHRVRGCDSPILSRIETGTLRRKSPSTPRLNGAIERHKSKVLERRKQVIKLLLMIIVAYFLCWSPNLILDILQKIQLPVLYSPEVYGVKIFVNCLPYIQSCLNPVFYCLMSRNIRTRFWLFFRPKSRQSGRSVNIELNTFTRSDIKSNISSVSVTQEMTVLGAGTRIVVAENI